MSRALGGLLLSLTAVACAEPGVGLAPAPADAGADAGLAMDAGLGMDAGPVDAEAIDAGRPATVCGGPAHPLGYLAILLDGAELLSLSEDGTERRLHRFFDGEREGWRLITRGQISERAAVFHAIERQECGDWPCAMRTEVVVVSPDRTWTWSRGIDEPVIDLVAAEADGRVLLRESLPNWRYRTLIVGPDGVEELHPEGVQLRPGRAVDGWRAAEHTIGEDNPRPVFVRAGEVRAVGGPRVPRADLWRGRWVWLGGTGVDVVGPGGARTIAVRGLSTQASLRRWGEDIFGIYEAQELAWVVRISDGTVAAPTVRHPAYDVGASEDGRWLLASDRGRPIYRLRADAATLRLEELDQMALFADGATPFEADYCSPPSLIDDAGRIAYAIRAPERSGWYRQTEAGTTELVGRPVFEAMSVQGLLRGSTWLVRAASGRDTFCPQVQPWPDAMPSEVLPLDHQMLVAGGAGRVLPESSVVLGPTPNGQCWVWQSAEPTAEDWQLVITRVDDFQDRVLRDRRAGVWLLSPIQGFFP